MKKIIKIVSILVIIMITLSYVNFSFAISVKVTEDNLKEALDKFAKSEENDKKYEITVNNNIINIKVDNESYELKYDLKDNPIFYLEIPVEKGMSYEEFGNQTGNMLLPMLGYCATANIQGVEFEDSVAYFTTSYLKAAFTQAFKDDPYIIIDDLSENRVETEKNDNPKVIYSSEFPERIMEYVNYVYGTPTILNDENSINSYTYKTEQKDVTENSCKIVCSIRVNLDADFSKIKGYADQLANAALDKNITEENADLLIKMKVGQVCKLESTKRISGYSMGGGCIEFSKDYKEIHAIKEGKANGKIYLGNDTNENVTFYAIVEKEESGISAEPINLNIDEKIKDKPDDKKDGNNKKDPTDANKDENTNKNNNTNTNTNANKNNNTNRNTNRSVSNTPNSNTQNINNKTDNTVSESKLPNAGIAKIGLVIVAVALMGIYSYKKYIDYNKMF